MKKKILALALVAVTLVAFSGYAQKPNDTKCTDKKECVKKGPKVCKGKCLFENLNLTDAQKQQIQELDSITRTQRRAQMQANKADRQKNDSVMSVKMRADRTAYLQNMKDILTPWQYQAYLENYYLSGGDKGNRPAFDRPKAPHQKDMKGRDKKHRGERRQERNRK